MKNNYAVPVFRSDVELSTQIRTCVDTVSRMLLDGQIGGDEGSFLRGRLAKAAAYNEAGKLFDVYDMIASVTFQLREAAKDEPNASVRAKRRSTLDLGFLGPSLVDASQSNFDSHERRADYQDEDVSPIGAP